MRTTLSSNVTLVLPMKRRGLRWLRTGAELAIEEVPEDTPPGLGCGAGGVVRSMLVLVAGVLAAPVIQVNPVMGSNLIIVVFAVVVIGGMGSIAGSIVTGLGLGLVEGLTKVVYPEASAVVIFVIMIVVLLFRPAGLFGKQA